MPKKYASMRERILANSAVSDQSSYNGIPCRVWLGRVTLNRSGEPYGRIAIRDKSGKVRMEFVHRVVVREVKGRYLSKRMKVLHLCNNSICCEELHVVGGSQRKNMQQCVADGRHGNAYRAPVRDMAPPAGADGPAA